MAFQVRGGNQSLVDLTDASQVIVTQCRAGDFSGTQERQRQAPAEHFAFGVGQRQQQTLDIQHTVIQPQHTAQRMGAQASHQGRGQFDPRAGVVVAGDHHDGQLRVLFVSADDEVVQPLLGFDRRVDGVEDIAGDQQDIGLAFGQTGQQPGQETGVFEVPFLAMEVLAQVPVGGVEQTHGGTLC